VFLEKRLEMVVACFGSAAAGAVFLPLNPVLKPEQVAHTMRDRGARVLVTSPQRWTGLTEALGDCVSLHTVVLTDAATPATAHGAARGVVDWSAWHDAPGSAGHRVFDTDIAAILYTRGTTGCLKGVVLSHRNMVAGAKSVASYLRSIADVTLIAALPLSFDAGFSQLTTAFHVVARVVLLNYLLPRDVLTTMARERGTGITAVPPLYIQLASLEWPNAVREHLRYFANTGGRMARETLTKLHACAPKALPFLMYGLTEAFRWTCLPPEKGGSAAGLNRQGDSERCDSGAARGRH